MARRLLAASVFGAMAIWAGICSPAVGQEPDLGRVTQDFLCTERAAVEIAQGLTRADVPIPPGECRVGQMSRFRIVAITMGPIQDFEGDQVYVVEVWGSQPVEHRFTIAWPGINAEFAGQES